MIRKWPIRSKRSAPKSSKGAASWASSTAAREGDKDATGIAWRKELLGKVG